MLAVVQIESKALGHRFWFIWGTILLDISKQKEVLVKANNELIGIYKTKKPFEIELVIN